MKNVLIIGHYGGDNFGDEIMLDSIIENLLDKDQIQQIFFVTKKPSEYTYPDKVVPLPNKVLKILRAIVSSRILILGGGTHFHDDYTNERYKAHFIYLLKIILISFFMRLMLGKVYFLGVGYGPLRRKSVKFFAKVSCQLANSIILRDRDSFELISNFAINSKKIQLSNDLVMLSTKTSLNQRKDETLGISVTSFKFNSQAFNDTTWEHEIFPRLTDIYATKIDLHVKLFVLRGGHKESDLHLTNSLFDCLSRVDSSRVELIDFTYDLKFFIDKISLCKYFIATRFHSAILAYLCGCSISIIPYHKKLLSFAKEINAEDRILDFEDYERFFKNIFITNNYCDEQIDELRRRSFLQYGKLFNKI